MSQDQERTPASDGGEQKPSMPPARDLHRTVVGATKGFAWMFFASWVAFGYSIAKELMSPFQTDDQTKTLARDIESRYDTSVRRVGLFGSTIGPAEALAAQGIETTEGAIGQTATTFSGTLQASVYAVTAIPMAILRFFVAISYYVYAKTNTMYIMNAGVKALLGIGFLLFCVVLVQYFSQEIGFADSDSPLIVFGVTMKVPKAGQTNVSSDAVMELGLKVLFLAISVYLLLVFLTAFGGPIRSLATSTIAALAWMSGGRTELENLAAMDSLDQIDREATLLASIDPTGLTPNLRSQLVALASKVVVYNVPQGKISTATAEKFYQTMTDITGSAEGSGLGRAMARAVLDKSSSTTDTAAQLAVRANDFAELSQEIKGSNLKGASAVQAANLARAAAKAIRSQMPMMPHGMATGAPVSISVNPPSPGPGPHTGRCGPGGTGTIDNAVGAQTEDRRVMFFCRN